MLINYCIKEVPKKKKEKTKAEEPSTNEKTTNSFLKNTGKKYLSLGSTTTVKLYPKSIDKDVKIMNSVEIKNYSELSDRMKNSLKSMLNAEFLTWIQKNSIPHIKSRKNTLIKSPSGTGKTIAYSVPIIELLSDRPTQISRKDGVYVLIIVPTKELAKQTFNVISSILKGFIWIQAGAVYGEDKRKSEKSRIRKGINILISTPGRIYDHLINTKSLDLQNLEILVIDEADLIFDLGYEHKINQILSELELRVGNLKKLQTVLLSATLDRRVNKLCSLVLENYAFIDASASDKMSIASELLSCNSQLEQSVVILPTKWRTVGLLWFLQFAISKFPQSIKIIIFVCSIYSVDFFKKILPEILKHYNSLFPNNQPQFFGLHGSLEIKERMKIFDEFSNSSCGVLVSTDVAARGLDFKDVHWVIQFDPARNPVDYVHRVGRTARAGLPGSAVVFLSPHEISYLDILKESGMEIGKQFTLKELGKNWIKHKNTKVPSLTDHIIEHEGSSIHRRLKDLLEESHHLKHLAAKCFLSSLKAYTSYPKNLKKYFNPKLLHSGHLAESLGLTESPRDISQFSKGMVGKSPKPDIRNRSLSLKRDFTFKNSKPRTATKPSSLSVSEFSSSVSQGPHTRKAFKL